MASYEDSDCFCDGIIFAEVVWVGVEGDFEFYHSKELNNFWKILERVFKIIMNW